LRDRPSGFSVVGTSTIFSPAIAARITISGQNSSCSVIRFSARILSRTKPRRPHWKSPTGAP
jgi:hypothetical protein